VGSGIVSARPSSPLTPPLRGPPPFPPPKAGEGLGGGGERGGVRSALATVRDANRSGHQCRSTSRAVWLNRTRLSSSVGGADRRRSLPRSTPLCTAGRCLIVSRQRATLGKSSSGWPSGLAISTHGQLAISAIE